MKPKINEIETQLSLAPQNKYVTVLRMYTNLTDMTVGDFDILKEPRNPGYLELDQQAFDAMKEYETIDNRVRRDNSVLDNRLRDQLQRYCVIEATIARQEFDIVKLRFGIPTELPFQLARDYYNLVAGIELLNEELDTVKENTQFKLSQV
jgi:hypothetical protein